MINFYHDQHVKKSPPLRCHQYQCSLFIHSFSALQHFYGPECAYLQIRTGDDKTEREVLGLIEMIHAYRTRVLDHLEMDMRQENRHKHNHP